METNSFAILCYIRTGKLDKLGNAPIYIRITVNTRRAEFSIKRKVQPKNWCSTKGRARGTNSKAKSLNHFIDELESKAYKIHSKLITKKKPFDAELIKRKLLNIEETHKTLMTIYDEYNAQIEELIGLDYSHGAYRRHIRTKQHLQDFIKREYKREDYFVKEIADACGIEKHLTFHLARHTFATTLTLANGIPIESVSKMLGHQSLKTTQIYAKVIDQKLKQDMDKLRGKY